MPNSHLLTQRNTTSIRDFIQEICQKAGMGEVSKDIGWCFNSRMTTTLGMAYFGPSDFRIEFSSKIWDDTTYEDRRNVIIHEIAHLLCYRKYKLNCGHNYLWRKMDLKCGGSGKRCHSVKVNMRKNIRKVYDVMCNCKWHRISANRYGRMKNGSSYICNRCGQPFRLETVQLSSVIDPNFDF